MSNQENNENDCEEEFHEDEIYNVDFEESEEIEIEVETEEEKKKREEEERKRREEERKRREEEENRRREEEEMKRWLVDFKISNEAGRRLLKDYRTIKYSNTDELGFTAVPISCNIFHWQIKIFKFDEKSEMYKDLQKYKQITNRDYVEMEVLFPPNYPFIPPFVRVVQPRFAFHSGRVTVGGSLCTDVLTMKSWSPIYEIETLMINILSEIQDGNPRIDFDHLVPYTLSEAKDNYVRVARFHGWEISKWLPN